jgi:hypothetical protein
VTPQTLNWNGPVDARVLFGGTIGENIGIVGAIENLTRNATSTGAIRATYVFSPGINLSLGNNFSAFSGLASPTSVYTNVIPTGTGTGIEFNYVKGESGGLNIIAGMTSRQTAQNNTAANKLSDVSYMRVKYKFGGAGLLSGAGGTYGNEFVGLDDSFQIGASVVSARNTQMPTYTGENMVYGADISGNYGNLSAGVAYSQDRDLNQSNYAVDAAYFFYPWMQARVTYISRGLANDKTNPTIATTLTGWLRTNVFLAGKYTCFTKNENPANNDGRNNADTFTLTAGYAF